MAPLLRPAGTAAGRPGAAVASVAPRRTPVVPALPVPTAHVVAPLVRATATRIAPLLTTTLLVRATATTVTALLATTLLIRATPTTVAPLLTTTLVATALLVTSLLATATLLGTTARAAAALGPYVVPPAIALGSSSVAPAVAGSSGSAATGIATARARPVVVAALLRGGVVHAVPLGWWDRPILPRREVASVPDVPGPR